MQLGWWLLVIEVLVVLASLFLPMIRLQRSAALLLSAVLVSSKNALSRLFVVADPDRCRGLGSPVNGVRYRSQRPGSDRFVWLAL